MRFDWLRQRSESSAFRTNVRVVNAPANPWLQDVYFLFLTLSWPAALSLIAFGWLFTNALFAVAYMMVGGIAQVERGSFLDAFHFSVQTFQTIGYGAMSPVGFWANLLVDLEAMTALVLTALATGLMFAKFGRATARVRFAKCVTVSTMDGVPTLMIRVGNSRQNQIINTRIRVVMFRTERVAEGYLFYRMIDLDLERDWAPALARSLLIRHPITPDSPLYGVDQERARAEEVELMVLITGNDDTLMSEVHAMKRYSHDDVVFNARHVDVLRETDTGTIVLDVDRFDDVEHVTPMSKVEA
ncbi:MAG: ion channel [Myxococcota bacterium]